MGDGASATATLLVAVSIDGREWGVGTRIVRARKRSRAIGHGECTEVPMAVGIETTARLRATVEGETRFMTSRAAGRVQMVVCQQATGSRWGRRSWSKCRGRCR